MERLVHLAQQGWASLSTEPIFKPDPARFLVEPTRYKQSYKLSHRFNCGARDQG